MNIIVCAKQVPNTQEVKLDQTTGRLMREGVPSIMNPDDKAGLEAALQLKDQYGAKVTLLTMGPPQAVEILREGLAMGADEVLLLSDRAFGGSDTLATSSIIAAAIRKMDYDLIITGRQAIDGDTAQVGPQIAEHLGLVNISYAEALEVEGDHIVVKRQYEDRYHKIKAKLPVVITALAELATPRYMTPGGIFDAYRTGVITTWGRADLEVDDAKIGLTGSPTRVFRSFTKDLKGKGQIVNVDTDESVEFLLEKFHEKFII